MIRKYRNSLSPTNSKMLPILIVRLKLAEIYVKLSD